jgi:hypothetical protein
VKIADVNLQSADKRMQKADATVPFDYVSLKIKRGKSLFKQPASKNNSGYEILEIVDAAGLSLVRLQALPVPERGSLVSLIVSEVAAGNFEEAKNCELNFEIETAKMTNPDLTIMKENWASILTYLFRSNDALKPFVEQQMTKYNLTEAEKLGIRGARSK